MRTFSEIILFIFSNFLYLFPYKLRRLTESFFAFLFEKIKWRLKVIESNIQIARSAGVVGPEFHPRIVYRHMAQLIFEYFFLFGPMKRFVRDEMEIRGVEHWKKALEENRGIVMLGSHLGNWEAMAIKGCETGMDILFVTKHLKPEWFHKLMEAARLRVGLKGTYEPKTIKDVLKQLKQNGIVGMVIDQYAGDPVGIRVPFFGIPVGTHSAIAFIVKRTNAIVLPVHNYFDFQKNKRIVVISAPIDWQEHSHPDYEIALNTFRYSQAIEKFIKKHPSEWLWTHRRFKGDCSPLRSGEWTEGRKKT